MDIMCFSFLHCNKGINLSFSVEVCQGQHGWQMDGCASKKCQKHNPSTQMIATQFFFVVEINMLFRADSLYSSVKVSANFHKVLVPHTRTLTVVLGD